jgi:hypothetical protein
MYRELVSDEEERDGDISVIHRSCIMVLRPIRDVDDLTDEEMSELNSIFMAQQFLSQSIPAMIKKADALRSRPKETEKERWIREAHDRCKKIPSQWDFNEELSKTWDAAFEAGRKAK